MNKRVIKIGAGVLTVVGLVSGAYALNEVTKEEGYTQCYVYTKKLDVLKDPFTGNVICEIAPMGYEVNKANNRGKKISPIALNPKEENADFDGVMFVRYRGKGIIERAFDQVTSLVKSR